MVRCAMLFPGQGSHAVGMGKELALESRAAREVFEQVDDALGFALSSLMWDGPDEKLVLTEHAQPAIMACSMAVLAMMREELGRDPVDGCEILMGHSLGEYSAYCASGSLSLAKTATLLRTRGQAMQEAVPPGEGAMAAILGLDTKVVEEVCAQASAVGIVVLANDNVEGQAVISGGRAAVEAASKLLSEKGAKRVVPLNVSAPFHSPLMGHATQVMSSALQKAQFVHPTKPVLCNVDVTPVSDRDVAVDCLTRQVEGRVRWRESIAWMQDHGITHCVELGHGKVITSMVRRPMKDALCANIQGKKDLDQLEGIFS